MNNLIRKIVRCPTAWELYNKHQTIAYDQDENDQSKSAAAWQEYIDHVKGCAECQRTNS